MASSSKRSSERSAEKKRARSAAQKGRTGSRQTLPVDSTGPTAPTARPRGDSKTERSWSIHEVEQLIAATVPLLELFSVVDDVFTENDALVPENRKVGMARMYRAWKACRKQLDPEFDARRYRRPRKKGTVRRGIGGR